MFKITYRKNPVNTYTLESDNPFLKDRDVIIRFEHNRIVISEPTLDYNGRTYRFREVYLKGINGIVYRSTVTHHDNDIPTGYFNEEIFDDVEMIVKFKPDPELV